MESPNPTFVFIPGAWHTPEYFQPLIDVLSSKPYSYPCVTVPLISVLSPKATTSITTMDPDIEVILKAISAVVDRGNDVILVMHSYGGVPASESTKYFQKPEQGKGRILRLVYVCSFVLGVGGCLMDGIGGKDLPWWNIDVSLYFFFLYSFVTKFGLREARDLFIIELYILPESQIEAAFEFTRIKVFSYTKPKLDPFFLNLLKEIATIIKPTPQTNNPPA